MKPVSTQISPLVRREWTPEEEKADEESSLQRQALTEGDAEEEGEEDTVQAERADTNVPNVISSVETAIQSIRQDGGQPLDSETRLFTDPLFGRDSDWVRAHTGSQAVDRARTVNAKAFSVGSEVVFGWGRQHRGRPRDTGWSRMS